MASRYDITQAEHDAAHLDLFGRERCIGCRSMLDPDEQVRYQLVGEESPTFCAVCQVRDDQEAAVEGAIPAELADDSESDTVETETLTDAQLLALLDEMRDRDAREGAAA